MQVIPVGMVGLGKMGLSHVAIVRAHPQVQLVAGCVSMKFPTRQMPIPSLLASCFAS